jgi:hypothetical protein
MSEYIINTFQLVCFSKSKDSKIVIAKLYAVVELYKLVAVSIDTN